MSATVELTLACGEALDLSINYRYGPIVYHWAQRSPGVEVDYPVSHSNWLTEHRYDGGLLFQAGPRPQLGDAQRDIWPELYDER